MIYLRKSLLYVAKTSMENTNLSNLRIDAFGIADNILAIL